MAPLTPPWELLNLEIEKIKAETNVIIIDCHAEATAEKMSCGYLAAKYGASAVLGTHTHVQTADEQILNNTTAYISDIGFCGSLKSIIGMEIESCIEKLLKVIPTRLEVGPLKEVRINGVELDICQKSGIAKSIKRIQEVLKLNDEVIE